MVPSKAPIEVIDRFKTITGFTHKGSSITYLGCPLYIERPRIIYFTGIVAKVIARIKGWMTKMLIYGGRVTLVKSVLQALPIHFSHGYHSKFFYS